MKTRFLAVVVMLLLSAFLAGCGCGGGDVELLSISVTPADPSIAPGIAQPFTATGVFSDSTTRDITTEVTWSSSDENVATISNAEGTQGWAAGILSGTTTITATSGNISGTTTLTVLPVLVSISVSPASDSLAIGAARQFTATGTYSDATTKDITALVTWSSSSPAVANVSNAEGSKGLAAAVAAGVTTITAASGDISGSAVLTVNPDVPPVILLSISVTPASDSVAIGANRQFTATGTYSDATTKDITGLVVWNSSSPATAAVSNAEGSKGLAAALAAGVTTITATSGNISGAAVLTVNPDVPPVILVSIRVTPENPWAGFNQTLQFTATGTYSDGSTKDITELSVWTSSKTEIATISNEPGSKGLATTDHKVGTTVITATLDGVSGSTNLFDP